jgi:hypothetical protein
MWRPGIVNGGPTPGSPRGYLKTQVTFPSDMSIGVPMRRDTRPPAMVFSIRGVPPLDSLNKVMGISRGHEECGQG